MLSDMQRDKIRAAFQKDALRVQSVSPEGVVEWKRVAHVQRAEVPWETIIESTTAFGPFVLTAGHRVFLTPTEKAEAQNLSTGDCLLGVDEAGEVICPMFRMRRQLPQRQFMYDLTAEDWHNFVLHRSRVVVSNSPDKFYHFRPPEHEGQIGQFNRVFGQVWEDAELFEYLKRSVDWFDMFPPRTSISTLNGLVRSRPQWRTAIYWGAIVHACFALATNWVADEFDYSIGGVSLSIEKSSKYESLKSNAEGQLSLATEAKQRTEKYIRGLQQPRFGIGIRSAFGPQVAKGVLSPRAFIGAIAISLIPPHVWDSLLTYGGAMSQMLS